jgi:phenylpyruvate tautomerase PptA (4-oxalocrotonate tautomerase family)
MPQTKIYGQRSFLTSHRTLLSDTIHSCMVEGLALPVDKRFQRFIPLDPEDFIYPDDRTERYLILEISMFEGRGAATKKDLIRLLIDRLQRALDLDPMDIEITLFETPRENWGLRGQCGDELALAYKVEPDQVEPDQVEPDQVEPDQVEPDQVELNQVGLDQVELDLATASPTISQV